ncbi:854_t:CDS:2, partial [Gigaspora rosea]
MEQQDLMVDGLKDFGKTMAKDMFVEVLKVIPFIGNVAAEIAQDIIELTEKAQHNKKACEYIQECLKSSLNTIAKFPLRGAIKESQEAYEKILNDIKTYVIEIGKPGKFSESASNWLKQNFCANNIEAVNERLFQLLKDATDNFYKAVLLDTNNQVKESIDQNNIQFTNINDKLDLALEVMITQKAPSSTEEDMKDLRINPLDIKDCKDNTCISSINIQKLRYIVDDVAVKKVPITEKRNIVKQAKLVKLLNACENIERFYGIYREENYIFVVTKWMHNGNLQNYLTNNKSIQWKTKLKIAEQIANGLAFCNAYEIYHRDVRSNNVLLDENLNAKLTNFETNRKFVEKSQPMSRETLRWTAPEKLRFPELPYTDKCEVYSFAILLWEISSQQIPFDGINDLEAKEEIKKGNRPSPFLESTPKRYKEIVLAKIKEEFELHQNESEIQSPATIKKHEPNDSKNQLAQNDDPLALYYMGLYLYEGTYGIKKDVIRALQLFLRSAKHGKVQSKYMYASACLTGPYYSFDEGIDYLKMAMKDNYPDALYMVSQIHKNGEHGYPIDNIKYQNYLKKAAENGSTMARKDLA